MQTTKGPAWVRPTADYGPLAAFFIAYLLGGLYVATGVLMAATVIAVALALVYERRVPPAPVVTAAIVMVFGGLTLWLQDERFIKMKPTIVQALFAVILFGGLLVRRPLLKPLLQAAWTLTDAGWHALTFRFGVFFAAMAALNEVVWRTMSTDVWVNFKIFGILLLTILFTVAQVPLIARHQIDGETGKEPVDETDDEGR
jgi:intracellular septation protein